MPSVLAEIAREIVRRGYSYTISTIALPSKDYELRIKQIDEDEPFDGNEHKEFERGENRIAVQATLKKRGVEITSSSFQGACPDSDTFALDLDSLSTILLLDVLETARSAVRRDYDGAGYRLYDAEAKRVANIFIPVDRKWNNADRDWPFPVEFPYPGIRAAFEAIGWKFALEAGFSVAEMVEEMGGELDEDEDDEETEIFS